MYLYMYLCMIGYRNLQSFMFLSFQFAIVTFQGSLLFHEAFKGVYPLLFCYTVMTFMNFNLNCRLTQYTHYYILHPFASLYHEYDSFLFILILGVNITSARFTSSSHLYFRDVNFDLSNKTITSLSFNFSTSSNQGLILWNGEPITTGVTDYLGVGVENGFLKIR